MGEGEAQMNIGILLLERDEIIESRAKRYKVNLKLGDALSLPFDRTLITKPGTAVPWELLPAAWELLDKWDAAVPFWEYTETAVNVGSHEDRKRTQDVVRDLRVLLHATELVFVKKNQVGIDLVSCWQDELAHGGDERLAFLRATYKVKPRLCILPTSWLNARRVVVTALPRQPRNADKPLIRVEIQPGRFVKCHEGDEKVVLAMMDRGRR
jgi:hypothetical protein